MKRIGVIWLIFAIGAAASCDQISLGPKHAESAPAPAPVSAPVPNLSGFVGAAYPEAATRAGFERFTPTALGLAEADQARLAAAMADAQPSWVAAGGGAHALLFTGCAAEGCETGRAVVAIDMATGAAFVGVRDSQGATELAPNPRLEALLRLTSPDRGWENPQPPAPQAATP